MLYIIKHLKIKTNLLTTDFKKESLCPMEEGYGPACVGILILPTAQRFCQK